MPRRYQSRKVWNSASLPASARGRSNGHSASFSVSSARAWRLAAMKPSSTALLALAQRSEKT
ncbi:hypothetical protein UCD39_27290 [Nitrospirillum sp. BR 11752]|uniref:hypothetical protein n=1 Tax=Nitrospirillum sp. BR 11752 TaxID=3104293 RepID=UPI002EB3ECC3|nr:hypothetical protein [Nitrospirillum sp. BR 11752]